MKNEFSKIILVFVLLAANVFVYKNKAAKSHAVPPSNAPIEQVKPEPKPEKPPEPPKPVDPPTPQLSVVIPPHLTYNQTVEQLKKWNSEAPLLTELINYGESGQKKELYCLRVTNKNSIEHKPKVLITAAIHGNEPWSSGIIMAYIGTMLSKYGQDKTATDLLDTRDLYFVPVVSADSYPHTRYVDGVDPNRNFPTPQKPELNSTKGVAALISLFWKIRPEATISGHTFGREFLIPYGDTVGPNKNQADYDRIVGEMAKLAKYKMLHASQLYSRPIIGSEIDYFYRAGSMAIVIEFGTHQRPPTPAEIKSEFDRTQGAITLFIKEAAALKIKAAEDEIDFSKNTGIARKYRMLPNGELSPVAPY